MKRRKIAKKKHKENKTSKTINIKINFMIIPVSIRMLS